MKHNRWMIGYLFLAGFVSIVAAPPVFSQDKKSDDKPQEAPKPDAARANKGDVPADWKPIDLKLPKPVFKGTPTNIPPGSTVEKPTGKPRPPFFAPPGAKNVVAGKAAMCSDKDPIIGKPALITDGDKEATESSYIELGPGVQYVQFDLGQPCQIYGIVFWHYHLSARIYHDVVVQVADDADFITNVRTLFNNDQDNSAGLGVGKDREYWETSEGKLVDAQGVVARYVRFYSKGSIADDQNHYIEVEVYALPAK